MILLLRTPHQRLTCFLLCWTNQLAPFRGEILTDPSNTWFLGSARVSPPNGISITSAIFVGHIRVTNKQTDRPRYVRHL